MSERGAGSTGDRELDLTLRLLVSAQLEEHGAPRQPQPVLVGRQLQRATQRRRGLRETSRRGLKLREIREIGRTRLRSSAAFEKLDGLPEPPALGQQSRPVERVLLKKEKRDEQENSEPHRTRKHGTSRSESNRLNLRSEISDSEFSLKLQTIKLIRQFSVPFVYS
jgi:hypothetical protein